MRKYGFVESSLDDGVLLIEEICNVVEKRDVITCEECCSGVRECDVIKNNVKVDVKKVGVENKKKRKKFNNLAGKRYGMLYVIECAGKAKDGHLKWLCECDCGNSKEILSNSLTCGVTTSCGCNKGKRIQELKTIDMTNMEFGFWKVLKYVGKSKWKCQCKCGNVKDVERGSLLKGDSTSCGCSNREDLTGKEFNNWTVIEYDLNKKIWHCECKCGNTNYVSTNDLKIGKSKSCGCIQKNSTEEKQKIIEFLRNTSSRWINATDNDTLPLYDSYSNKLNPVEQVRRNEKHNDILEIKCLYCGQWFIPTAEDVRNRIKSINKIGGGGNSFYCSDGCKTACPIFNRSKFPKDYELNTSREVQPELRKMVLELDNWECQRCGKNIDEIELHCHHIDPVINNPIESADVDNCITFCIVCHHWIHKNIPGCSYGELSRCLGDYTQ